MLTNEYPVVTSELGVGLGLYGACTNYNNLLENNGAQNPLGALYAQPSPSNTALSTVLGTSAGYGSLLIAKYVLYKSTGNPATKTGPAPVYWTDETFTTVSGVFSESYGSGNANDLAGWLLPNTTTCGSGFTNTVLNNGGNGTFVWIAVQGFVKGAVSVASTAIDDILIGASGNFTVARVISGTAPTNYPFAIAKTAIASSLSDILVCGPIF